MKKDDLIKESTDTWHSQAANVRCSTKGSSPTKTSPGSSSLNNTKIKYLLNPSAATAQPVQQQQQQQPHNSNDLTQSKFQEEQKPLTINSELPASNSIFSSRSHSATECNLTQKKSLKIFTDMIMYLDRNFKEKKNDENLFIWAIE